MTCIVTHGLLVAAGDRIFVPDRPPRSRRSSEGANELPQWIMASADRPRHHRLTSDGASAGLVNVGCRLVALDDVRRPDDGLTLSNQVQLGRLRVLLAIARLPEASPHPCPRHATRIPSPQSGR